MNFGERFKQVRTDKGLTQPQFAQMAGIEQSYLSMLENDKSLPSTEMFSTILAGIGMDEKTFLKMQQRFPGRPLEKAVKGMLPKGPLGYAMIKKLKVYAEGSHPHAAQQPQALTL